MVDKLELASFILGREKTSWGDLEKQFCNYPTLEAIENRKIKCSECGSSNIVEQIQASLISEVESEKTGFFICGDCGKPVRVVRGIARQTLLNNIKGLIQEGIIEKVIDKETLRPIYRGTPNGREKVKEMEIKKRLHSCIDNSSNIQETLKKLRKYIEDQEKK
jgi:DNA-binding MarR family transcriptional regulator